MNSHIDVYLHFVWGTWNREPFIQPFFERELWDQMRNEVVDQKCRLYALGGTEDHVHLLVQIHSTITLADFAKRVKGNSSMWVNKHVRPEFLFKWQGSYGVFSVGRNEVPEIVGYIKKQKKHHAENTLIDIYERMTQPSSESPNSSG